jgi:hypothetical protein
MSDRLVAEAATYATHNNHKRRISMPSAGFEHAIAANERPQTYAFDLMATGISIYVTSMFLPMFYGFRAVK